MLGRLFLFLFAAQTILLGYAYWPALHAQFITPERVYGGQMWAKGVVCVAILVYTLILVKKRAKIIQIADAAVIISATCLAIVLAHPQQPVMKEFFVTAPSAVVVIVTASLIRWRLHQRSWWKNLNEVCVIVLLTGGFTVLGRYLLGLMILR